MATMLGDGVVVEVKAARPRCRAAAEIIAPGECDPRAAGLEQHHVECVVDALHALYNSGQHPGLSLCVHHKGVVVVDRALGHARGAGPGDAADARCVPMAPDTPVCLFSATKAVTAVLAHKLAEQGELDLDAPVARYLPDFAQHGKGRITVADVLSHRSGVARPKIPKAERTPALLEHPDRILKYICAAQPHDVGRFSYHALTAGYLIGAIVERVTGIGLNEYLEATLRQPLGMRYFTYGLPAAQRAQVAQNYMPTKKLRFPITAVMKRILLVDAATVVEASNQARFLNAVIPAGNLHATAAELARFFQMLLDGGRYAGQQLLAPKTVARLLQPRGRVSLDRTLLLPMRYSEGLMLGTPGVGLFGLCSADAWGHLGFTNVLGWAQPSRGNAAALLSTGNPVLGRHLLPLVKLLAAIRALP